MRRGGGEDGREHEDKREGKKKEVTGTDGNGLKPFSEVANRLETRVSSETRRRSDAGPRSRLKVV